MAKTPEELKALKEKVDSINDELQDLSDDELEEIFGGFDYPLQIRPGDRRMLPHGPHGARGAVAAAMLGPMGTAGSISTSEDTNNQ